MERAIPINRYPKYSQARNAQMQNGGVIEELEKRQRIKIWMAACLVITALGIDGFQIILDFVGIGPFINWMINPAVNFLFILWFWLLGVSFTGSTKKIAVMFATAIIGVIPVLNMLPELTLGVLGMVLLVRAEDRGGIIGKAANMAAGGLKKAA